MQKLTRGLVPLIGIALILAGVYLIFKPKIDAYLTNKENEQKIEVYEESQQNAPSKVPEIPKDPSKVVGVLEVPSVGIKEAVYPGPATPEQLEHGVSLAEKDESLKDQNIAIAGHTNYSLNYQFTELHKAKKGAEVIFKLGKETRKYQITSIKDVDPYQVEVLEEMKKDKDQLTLITCDDYDEKTGQWLTRKIYVAERVQSSNG
ncbi:class A sortase SrtA [Staphylococcus pseudintermedius]|uniref:class A sortase SrtA n=2 Tax=Bacteria TaxID=2 RepID=UPI001933C8F3|nr:class A sortase SrtA [Staphylococcus pseudintermedius]EHT6188760.1 class A sortase SrtA [Staphylococcus pseudintermedius]EHT7654162.1 class A sortase SrtA [Staphylococcus pseudintermedius]EKH2224958.1 class A sortase SrtA [Staphylococcus pseudintermedius]EKO8594572.1 class A sortase SrtA [Staphylococcus pseudintermedius]EKO8600080.1 class A sortase SrtA [Staphylococcus pseudintermedius]